MFEIIIVYFTTIINQKIQMSLTRLVKSSFKELAGNGLNNGPICPAYKGHLMTTKKIWAYRYQTRKCMLFRGIWYSDVCNLNPLGNIKILQWGVSIGPVPEVHVLVDLFATIPHVWLKKKRVQLFSRRSTCCSQYPAIISNLFKKANYQSNFDKFYHIVRPFGSKSFSVFKNGS